VTRIIGIDPGAHSGLAVRESRPPFRLRAIWACRPKGSVLEVDDATSTLPCRVGAEDPVAFLCRTIDDIEPTALWLAVVERPFSSRGPVAAERWWLDVLTVLAKRRAEDAGLRYRKPLLLRPRAGTWRSQLGLPVRALKGVGDGSAWLKAKAIDFIDFIDHVALNSADAAEAACQALWAARAAMHGGIEVGKKVAETRWVQ